MGSTEGFFRKADEPRTRIEGKDTTIIHLFALMIASGLHSLGDVLPKREVILIQNKRYYRTYIFLLCSVGLEYFIYLFIRTTTSSIHTEAILAEVTMSTKNTMVRRKKGKGWLKIMGNRTASAAAAAGAAHICSTSAEYGFPMC